MYAASNLDRLYLGKNAPLALVGIYGIARAIAELPTTLARRMSYQIIFPALAGTTDDDRGERLAGLARTRLLFILTACMALAFGAGISDWLIQLVYDPRYAAAGWMLAILLVGALFATLSNLNEALLLGAGRPLLSSLANLARLASLAALLPLGFAAAGFAGAVIAVALVEAFHYLFIALGQWRVRTHYFAQDALALLLSGLAFAIVTLVRELAGWNTALTGLWGGA
jgi:O-antigen/teichoic acid export membrane protein